MVGLHSHWKITDCDKFCTPQGQWSQIRNEAFNTKLEILIYSYRILHSNVYTGKGNFTGCFTIEL